MPPEFKNKVLAYIVREQKLLVFTHRDFPEAGLQVPAGTVDAGEEIEKALLREVEEESGLIFREPGKLLGKFRYFRHEANEMHLRHVFQLEAPSGLLDSWEHTVKGHGGDHGLVFTYFWLPIAEAQKKLAAKQGDYLVELLSQP